MEKHKEFVVSLRKSFLWVSSYFVVTFYFVFNVGMKGYGYDSSVSGIIAQILAKPISIVLKALPLEVFRSFYISYPGLIQISEVLITFIFWMFVIASGRTLYLMAKNKQNMA